ncbi:MAG: hypothetical protein QOF51_2100, partial [Chloroflexota bacterium]|nr:hypothetical protein [Chloroflexota bacterium]
MPPGAMESNNPLGVGRVSHVVLESRDLNRTEELISRFCAIDAIHNADVDKDTLPFRLEGGGRMIFKRVDQLDERTGTHNKWTGQHAALLIRNEEFFDSHLKLWDALPESELKRFSTEPLPDETNLPPRTELHGPIALGEHAGSFQRGTTFYDWDTNTFHFSGGIGLDGSMANYRIGHDDQNFPKELLAQAQG